MFSAKKTSFQDNDTKLALYSRLKGQFKYESYLDAGCHNIQIFTKFRMSNHCLPIERGRYTNLVIPRVERLCYFCKEELGNERHVLMECTHPTLRDLTEKFLPRIFNVLPITQDWSKVDIFNYILLGIEKAVVNFVCEWLIECNILHREKLE